MNAEQFDVEFRKALNLRGRHIFTRPVNGKDGSFGRVYINFINLPEHVCKNRLGGGAEAENNRTSFWVHEAANGKIKVELSNTTLPRSFVFRGKTASPEIIYRYVSDFLNHVVANCEPNYTHTSQADR